MCIESDDLVGVKVYKMRLLSNLLRHTLLIEKEPKFKEEIMLITKAFLNSKYREALLTESSDFKEEKKRLQSVAKENHLGQELQEFL